MEPIKPPLLMMANVDKMFPNKWCDTATGSVIDFDVSPSVVGGGRDSE